MSECPYGSQLKDCPFAAKMKNCSALQDGCPFFAKVLPKLLCNQGDQIGRIFAYWVIVFFGQLL
jgi:hypothetical protein